ncbi:MAG: hypothetical protein JG782_1931 [Anaerophaga sp.]|nr:hypothetical protein [Anaerophaga sp.]MDI3520729.1 hypothetical protein [Anaerophaga sp.]MDN5291064.1 hypothetical protein [Anaerophaga sp.]
MPACKVGKSCNKLCVCSESAGCKAYEAAKTEFTFCK